jgi:hypothetical protein
VRAEDARGRGSRGGASARPADFRCEHLYEVYAHHQALSQDESISRRAANVLILAIQAVILDSHATLGMLHLTEYQENLAVYLMEKNGLRGDDLGHSAEQREKVVGEMVGLLGKATREV